MASTEDKFAIGTVIFMIMIACASFGGWIANIVKLAGLGVEPITIELVIRVIGIFVAPLGIVMGYL